MVYFCMIYTFLLIQENIVLKIQTDHKQSNSRLNQMKNEILITNLREIDKVNNYI